MKNIIQDGKSLFFNVKIRSIAIIPVGTVILALAVFFLSKNSGYANNSVAVSLYFGILFLLILWFLWFVQRSQLAPANLLGIYNPKDWKWILYVIPLVVITDISSDISLQILVSVSPKNIGTYIKSFSETIQNNPWWVTSLKVVAFPIIEELILRGIVFQRIAAKWNIPTAIIFMLPICFIGNPFLFLQSFLFATVMCIIYVKTSSLLLPVACNVAYTGIIEYLYDNPKNPIDLFISNPKWKLLLITASFVPVFILIKNFFSEGKHRLPYDINDSRSRVIR